MNLPQHTGIISEQEADAQTERVKQIMTENGCMFGEACNVYMYERAGLSVLHKPYLAPDVDCA